MQDFRVIDLPERTTLDSSDYTMIDSAENGTNKYLLSRQTAETDAKIATAVGGVEEELNAAVEGIEESITALQGDVETVETTLGTKADKDGTYPDMAVGSVLGTNTVTDREPYFLRPSASIGDREFDTLVGGSLGWNQLCPTQWKSTKNTDITDTRSYIQLVFRKVSSPYTVILNSAINETGMFAFIGKPTFDGGTAVVHNGIATNITLMSDVSVQTNHVYLYSVKVNGCDPTVLNGIDLDNQQVFDLTTLFGSTIADYIYTLETAHAGDGVAWVKKYLPETYYAYCAPTLKHVTGVSAHVMRDANDNVIGNYPLDSTWVGMGIPKLDSDNKLYFDGDRYASDGTVTVKYAIRAYESGDTSDGSTMITDGTNTVYKLTTSTTDSATPFTSPQICDKYGTEEYVTTGLVPVGHETEYVENLADKLTDIPNLPTTAGNYHLAVTVDGGVPSYSWVSA